MKLEDVLALFTLSLFLARVSTWNKNFACAGQLINTTPIQAVNLPTMIVKRLRFSFDQNELGLRNVELWWLGKFLPEAYKSDYIQLFLNVPMKHILEKQKEIWLSKKKHSFISASLQLQHWKNQNNDLLCQLSWAYIYFG